MVERHEQYHRQTNKKKPENKTNQHANRSRHNHRSSIIRNHQLNPNQIQKT